MTGSAGARRNSFDALRLAAALAVAFGHQMDFAGRPEPALGPLGVSLSNTGLFVFFALSGYLIWRSLERDPRPRRFFLARLLRIYPGAAVATLACVLLGAAVTTMTAIDYWRSGETWAYLLHGVAIAVTPTRFTLPGVFTDARWSSVDTPVWTLKYELACYAAAFALHRLVGPRSGVPRVDSRPILAAAVASLALGTAWHLAAVPLPGAEEFYARYNAFNALRFGAVFALGALLAAAEGEGGAPWAAAARAAPAALACLAPDPSLNRVGLILLVAVLAVDLGRSPTLFSARYRRFGDLSYGLYLYSYPVQSLVMAHLYDGTNFAATTLASLVVALGCAILSWRLVEGPASRFRHALADPSR